MSVSRMAGELRFMEGNYYDVINTIENNDLSKNSTFMILALSHLAVGNFVNFYNLMDPYIKGEMHFIDLPDNINRFEEFPLGYVWHHIIGTDNIIFNMIDIFNQFGIFAKKDVFNNLWSDDVLTNNIYKTQFITSKSTVYYGYAEKYLLRDDIVDLIVGCGFMEALEYIQYPYVSRRVYDLKARMLNVINSLGKHTPVTDIMNRGIALIKMKRDCAERSVYDE